MEEKDGALVLGRRGEEDGVIAVGMDATGDEGAGRLFDAQALCGDGDASVGADAVGFSSANIPRREAHAFAAHPSLRSGCAANALSCFNRTATVGSWQFDVWPAAGAVRYPSDLDPNLITPVLQPLPSGPVSLQAFAQTAR
jgi:hypothetical protein